MRTIVQVLLVATLHACGARIDQVPLSASPQDVKSIAGTWGGTYETTKGGTRRGYIHFAVTAESDTAHGYVVMMAESHPQEMNLTGRIYSAPPIRTEQVAIRFVVVSGGFVRGELENYRDPECACQLSTVFMGRRDGDVFSGTFQTRHSDTGLNVSGTWRTVRSTTQRGNKP